MVQSGPRSHSQSGGIAREQGHVVKISLLETTLVKIITLTLFINIILKTDATSNFITKQYLLNFMLTCKLHHLMFPNRFVLSRKIVLSNPQPTLNETMNALRNEIWNWLI